LLSWRRHPDLQKGVCMCAAPWTRIAAVLGGAVALLAPSTLSGFRGGSWRRWPSAFPSSPRTRNAPRGRLGRGVLAPTSEDGAFADALAGLLGSTAAVERQAVLAADRGRAFSWMSAAERSGSCTPTCEDA
jgi:hypothetical protein